MREALMRLLEPPIEALGFELLDLELAQAGRGGGLRIFIDDLKPDASVTVEDCAAVSHAVSEVLEIEDPIKGNYTLEVSSPGFDRILRKRAHFERFVGERIFVGTLKSIGNDSILVEVDGRPYELPLERIQKARLRPE